MRRAETLFFVAVFFDGNAGFLKHLHREFIGIAVLEDHTTNSAVNDHFAANGAGLMGAVDGAPFYADAELRRLNDCILFGVNGITEFMASAARDIQLAA